MAFRHVTRLAHIALLMSLAFLLCTDPSRVRGSREFVVKNGCSYTVWPAALGNAGVTTVGGGGWELPPGSSTNVSAPDNWSGRLWARTRCSFVTGNGTAAACATGDCGGNAISCSSGAGPSLPVTLVEFTLSATIDYYDVSLVDGFNVPVSVVAAGTAAAGACGVASCAADVNAICPAELRVYSSAAAEEVVACKSACEAFGAAEYCCRGAYASAGTCSPTNYSQIFKAACPAAYSYAFDDPTSTFTCSAAPPAYLITFCPDGGAAAANSTQRASTGYGSPPSTSSSSGSIFDWAPNSSGHQKLCGNPLCACILAIFSHFLILHRYFNMDCRLLS